jgi:hypothetical protein
MTIKEAFTIVNMALDSDDYKAPKRQHLRLNAALDTLAAFIMKHSPPELVEKTESNSS